MKDLQQILNSLENNIADPDFSLYCEEAVAEIEGLPSPEEAIQPLLQFMTVHSDLDYGTPGAFVHFIETFPEAAYTDFLIATIKQQPTEYNTWMLHRIMNTWKSPRQAEYISVIKEALSHVHIAASLKDTLSEYLEDFEA